MLPLAYALLRSDRTLAGFVAIGMAINSLLHLYRFHLVGWVEITGLPGQSQSITLSFWLCLWVLLPIAFGSRMLALMRRSIVALVLIPLLLVIANEVCGRSMLKLLFDVLLVGILYVWLLVDHGYSGYVDNPPTEAARPFIISELITLFQISLAILTFVIATFGFSFAPSYIEKYYHQDIGQPTVWWFGAMTLYLSVGVILFVTVQSWALAVQLRRKL